MLGDLFVYFVMLVLVCMALAVFIFAAGLLLAVILALNPIFLLYCVVRSALARKEDYED